MFTLSASDHRPGAYGDSRTAQVESIEAGHAMAAELNCGLYSIDDVLFESDGTDYWTYFAADDTTTGDDFRPAVHTTARYTHTLDSMTDSQRGHVCGDSMAVKFEGNLPRAIQPGLAGMLSIWTAPRVAADTSTRYAFTN